MGQEKIGTSLEMCWCCLLNIIEVSPFLSKLTAFQSWRIYLTHSVHMKSEVQHFIVFVMNHRL